MSRKPTTVIISVSDPVAGAREALRVTRMLCRDAAATRPERDATKRALEAAVSALSCELIDLEDALDEDEIELAYERDMQRCLPGLPAGAVL